MLDKLMAAFAALALVAAAPALGQGEKNALGKQDQQYFRSLAQDNMAEVQAGKLAEQRASAEEVKEFGEHMVKDHGEMLEQQRSMAQFKGVQMPKAPGKEQQAAMKKLQGLQGERFDRAYMSQMVKDHEKALKLVQEASRKAQDAQLRAMAEKAEPKIAEHLQMAKQISDKAAAGATRQDK